MSAKTRRLLVEVEVLRGYRWIACDADGSVWAYRRKPRCVLGDDFWSCGATDATPAILLSSVGARYDEWRESCERISP